MLSSGTLAPSKAVGAGRVIHLIECGNVVEENNRYAMEAAWHDQCQLFSRHHALRGFAGHCIGSWISVTALSIGLTSFGFYQCRPLTRSHAGEEISRPTRSAKCSASVASSKGGKSIMSMW